MKKFTDKLALRAALKEVVSQRFRGFPSEGELEAVVLKATQIAGKEVLSVRRSSRRESKQTEKNLLDGNHVGNHHPLNENNKPNAKNTMRRTRMRLRGKTQKPNSP